MILPANPFRIVLADVHALLRQDLKRFLGEKTDLEVVGEAENGLDLLSPLDRLALSGLTPHLVILDISMPMVGGFEALHLINKAHPGVNALICTIHNDNEFVCHAIAMGARGYLLKEDMNAELFSAIDKIRQGGVYVSKRLYDPS